MVVLKGVPSILSPDLLHVLASMGHGDEIGESLHVQLHVVIDYIVQFNENVGREYEK